NYTIYGYLSGIAAPFDAAGQVLLAKYPDANIYHGRVVPAKNDIGYEVRILHLMGRDKKTAKYEIFNGNPQELERIDGNPPPTATAHLVWVETAKDEWKLYNINNWFHKWSDKADPVIYAHFADKQAPYDIYGFINGQSAPFSKKSQEIIEKSKGARMFHGLI